MIGAATDKAAGKDGENPMYSALTDLLSEMTDKPLKHTIAVNSNRNWRTRQVVCELKKIKSLTELFCSEEQIRGVVISQEARCRVKIFKAFLSAQCLTEERALICEEERQYRYLISSVAFSGIITEASWWSIVGNEMHCRFCIEREFARERLVQWSLSKVELLIIVEQICRRSMIQKEMMGRRETEQRRFLSASREIDMELLFQQSYRVTSWARLVSSKNACDIAKLFSEEERDRCSLERLYLLKLSLIANDQENAAARLVVISVMKASLIRRRIKEDTRMKEIASRLLLLLSKESDLRGIIERDEMEKRQKLRVSFFTLWRDVFKNAPIRSAGAAIVERLEIYERHCLFDQWRFDFNTLSEREGKDRFSILRRENEWNAFFQTVVHSLTALWKQESEQFHLLRKLYGDFAWSNRMLNATVVLKFEESCERRKIVELEVRDTIRLRAVVHAHELGEMMLRKAQSIMEMEEASRLSLALAHADTIAHHFCEQLFHEEENLRLEVEREARDEWTNIVLDEAALRGSCAEKMKELEASQCALLMEEKRKRLLYHELLMVARMERVERGHTEEEELRSRFYNYSVILGYVESWNRLELMAESQYQRYKILLCKLVKHEEVERIVVEDCERQRRSFLFDSFDYAFPHLRACEVDEMNDRLDIINEAEITMGAMTYNDAPYCRTQYCSEELRSAHAALHFMSSTELSRVQSVELVCAVEPLTRRTIVKQEMVENLLFTLVVQEWNGRHHIIKAASDAYDVMQNLFNRIVSRADEWQTRSTIQNSVVSVPCEEEVLLDYFRRREADAAARLKAQKKQTREMLQSFFEGFYWGRDSIVLEEFVARDGLRTSLCQDYRLSSSISPTLATHLNIRFYNIALVRASDLKPLSIRMFDTLDEIGVTCELHEVQSIAAAGTVFRVCFPTSLLEWVRPLDDEINIVYFEIREIESGDVVATASLLLRSEDLHDAFNSRVASLPFDDDRGKVNVVLHVQ